MKKFLNRKGVIALITMLVLLGVGLLGVAMVINSQLNTTAANNYRYKIQTYCAADGLVTLLAQDLLDFKEANYLLKRPHADIGSPTPSGFYGYSYDSLHGSNTADTLRGGGKFAFGTTDKFHYSYCKMSGTLELIAQVYSMKVGSGTSKHNKAGIMIRQDLTPGSVYVATAYVDTTKDSVRLESRKVNGNASANRGGVLSAALPVWLKLNKTNTSFEAFYSTDGNVWTLAGRDTITMSDPVYAGLFVGSGTTTLDTVVFTNSNGIPINVRIDSTTIGSIPVKYNMYQTERNAFFISTEGYMKRGSTSTHNYVTKLLQNLSRERQGQWHSTVSDSAWIPVVLYDMRANTTNSNFQGHPGGLPVKTGMIQNYLDADRKPVLKANVYFNDQLNNWFRPSGADAAALFDPTAMRWSGLKNRPDAKGGSVPDEWVGNNYDSTNANADIVIFDSLKFLEKKTEAGVFTFGDSIMPHWLIETGWTSSDPAYFNYTRPPNVYNVFSPLRKWNYAANTIPASRPYARGFGFDLPSSIATRPNPLATHSDSVIWFSQNYAYTMEIHRLFTYKPGQKFIFMGNDDVWLFINNALVLDMGGVHGIAKDSVNLDALGLTSGNEYWFDFFYCERNGLGAEIFITTNMLIFLPPQPLKRSWKRDYGNLD